jgi:hypothetical protein
MKIFQPILALLLPLKAMACGLDWSPPVSHFENVDYQGNVHIVRKISEVEKLPLYLIFNSTFGNSPYVGSGFELPFLEARMWQVDEGRLLASDFKKDSVAFRNSDCCYFGANPVRSCRRMLLQTQLESGWEVRITEFSKNQT